MHVALLRVEIFLKESMTLKEKRSVLKGLKTRMRNNFNVSAAEVGLLDHVKMSESAVVAVSNERKHLSGTVDRIVAFIGNERRLLLSGHSVEIL